jgi:hypothetical protein
MPTLAPLSQLLDEALDWLGAHPLITIVLFIILFFGGCSVAVHVGIVSSQTKLMPY